MVDQVSNLGLTMPEDARTFSLSDESEIHMFTPNPHSQSFVLVRAFGQPKQSNQEVVSSLKEHPSKWKKSFNPMTQTNSNEGETTQVATNMEGDHEEPK